MWCPGTRSIHDYRILFLLQDGRFDEVGAIAATSARSLERNTCTCLLWLQDDKFDEVGALALGTYVEAGRNIQALQEEGPRQIQTLQVGFDIHRRLGFCSNETSHKFLFHGLEEAPRQIQTLQR